MEDLRGHFAFLPDTVCWVHIFTASDGGSVGVKGAWGGGLRRRAARLSLVGLAAAFGLSLTADVSAAELAATASVTPNTQFVGDSTGQVFTFTINNTGTTAPIQAVEITAPNRWTITACPSRPAGWSAKVTRGGACRYVDSGRPNPLLPGASSSAFTLRATTAAGSNDATGNFAIGVSKHPTTSAANLTPASSSSSNALQVVAHSFEVTDAVVAASAPAPGSACPTANREAITGSTQTIVICGRNRTTGTPTPVSAWSSLGGTFIGSPGTFSSGAIAPTASPVVLGSWNGATVTSTTGTGHTVVSTIGSHSDRTSPVTTVTGYETTNNPPDAVDDSDSTNEDTNKVVDVLANDSDLDGDTFSVTAVGTPDNGGSVSITNAGTDVTFNVGSDFQDLDTGDSRQSSFTYTITDQNGATDTATVTVTVTGVEDSPIAVDDSDSTNENTAKTVDVLGNDTDPDDTLTVTAVDTTGTSGTVTITNAGANVSYDPNGEFDDLPSGSSRQDTFTYTVSDGNSTDTATVTMTVTGVNDAPVVTGDTVAVDENSPNGTAVHTVAFTDPDNGDTHAFSITGGNTGGAFAIGLTTGAVTVADSSDLDFETNATFNLTVQVTDNGTPNLSGTATITVNLNNVNEAPVVDAATVGLAENSPNGTAVHTVTFSDQDTGQAHTYAITGGNTGGAFAMDPGTGAITVADTSDVDFETNPIFSLTAQVTDDGTPNLSGTATITVNLTNVNEAPIIAAPASIPAEHEIPEVLTGVSVADPDGGTLTFTVGVDDGTLTVDTGVTGGVGAGSVSGNGTDAVTLTGTATQINNTLADADGVTYLSDTGFTGVSDTLELTLVDSLSLSDTDTVTISFNAVPVAADTSGSSAEDGSSGPIQLSATDADDEDLTFTIFSGPANGTLSAITGTTCAAVNACTANVTYTPNANHSGSDSFTFQVDDGNSTDTGLVSITVSAVNDAPVITLSAGTPSYTEGAPATVVDSALTVTDVDDTQLVSGSVTISAGSVSGDTLSFTPAGGITDTNAAADVLTLSGAASLADWQSVLRSVTLFSTSNDPTAASRTVTFTVNDGDVSSSPVNKSVTVVPVNDAPVLTQPDAAALSYTENATTVVAPNTTAADVDNPNLASATIQVTGNYQNGQDVLSLGTNPQSGITAAAFNTTTGTLTLAGSSSVANYQAALRDVRYTNTSDDPNTSQRTLTFQVNDGAAANNLSNTVTRLVTVVPVNDAPVAANQVLTTSSSIKTTIGNGDTGRLISGATDPDDPAGELTISATFTNVNAGATGVLTDAATGTYTYNPAAGFTGTDVFNYQVCDDGSPAAPQMCDTGQVTVTINGVDLWFVNASAGAGGTGRLTDPFDSLSDLPAGRGSGDRVFLYSGTHSGGAALFSGEHLIGQAATGSTFDTLLGVQVPANGTLDARPGLGGGAVTIQNTVTLATNSKVQGVDISSTTNTGLSGSAVSGVDVSQMAIITTSGTALSLNNVGGTLTFTDLDKTGAGTGISLTSVGANVTVPSGATITNTTTGAIFLDGGAGNFSYAGSIASVSAGREVTVQNKTVGAVVTFSGAIGTTGTPLGGTGILLNNNDQTGGSGGSISFSGGVNLSTGASAAFTATNGGVVDVTGTNTLATTTATALNVSDTTIGASGITFRSINVDGSDALPVNGILIDTTGATAGLTVTGTGSAASGGTIQDTSGNGIELIGTRAPSLSWMTVTSNLGNGIHGGDGTAGGVVTDATLANLVVSNNGNDSGSEDGILFQGLVGTATFSNLNVSGSARHNIAVINNTGTLSSLTVSGSNIHDNAATSSNGLVFIADGTATMTASVSTTNFTANRVNGVLSQTLSAGTLTVSVTGGTFTNNFVSVEFTHASSGSLTGTFTGGTITNAINGCSGSGSPCGAPVNLFLSNQASSSAGSILRATITNNTINNGGSGNAPGIWMHTGLPVRGHARLLLTGNTITNVNERGIAVEGGGCTAPAICDGTVDATIENNTITLGAGALDGVHFNVGTAGTSVGNNDTLAYCGDIENNTLSSAGGDGIRLRHRSLTTIRLPGYGGMAFDTAAVVAYLDGRNPATADTITAATSSAGGGFVNATCLTP